MPTKGDDTENIKGVVLKRGRAGRAPEMRILERRLPAMLRTSSFWSLASTAIEPVINVPARSDASLSLCLAHARGCDTRTFDIDAAAEEELPEFEERREVLEVSREVAAVVEVEDAHVDKPREDLGALDVALTHVKMRQLGQLGQVCEACHKSLSSSCRREARALSRKGAHSTHLEVYTTRRLS